MEHKKYMRYWITGLGKQSCRNQCSEQKGSSAAAADLVSECFGCFGTSSGGSKKCCRSMSNLGDLESLSSTFQLIHGVTGRDQQELNQESNPGEFPMTTHDDL